MTVYRTNKTSRESIRATCIWYISVPNSKNIRTTVLPIHLKLACEKSTGAWCMELPLPYSLRNLAYRLLFNEMSPLFAILLHLIWSCQYPCNVLAITTCMCHPSTLILQLSCATHLLLYYNLHVPPIYSYITTCMCHPSTLILQLTCATHLLLYYNLHVPPIYSYITTCICHPSTLIFYKKGLKKPKK
jgi:hypothetical protein